MFIFNGTNRTIQIDKNATQIQQILFEKKWYIFDALDLYSAWKRWCVFGEGAKFPRAFYIVGGEDIGDNIRVGSYVFLAVSNNWKMLPPEENNVIISIQGNLYPDIAKYPIFQQLPNYNSIVLMQASSLTQIASTTQGGLTQQQNQLLEQAAIEAKKARQLQSNKAVISPDKKYVTIYADDNITILHKFRISDDQHERTPI